MNNRLGELVLERVPAQPKQPLRAWDAADEYVLGHIVEDPILPEARVVVVNDSFGALTCALRSHDPIVINESAAGCEAITKNLAANDLDPIEAISMLDLADQSQRPFDVAIIKIPKANGHLADLLHRLRPHLHDRSRIIGAAMAKHLHTSALELFEEIIGSTTTSLAKKKARLIHVAFDGGAALGATPWPVEWTEAGIHTVNYGGGFSPNSLDIGTRTLLDNVADFSTLIDDDPATVVDLGSGNGIIGLRVARDFTAAGRSITVEAIDDSALAIAATQASWQKNDFPMAELSVRHHHRMVEVLDPGSVDLVVVNPPFHNDRVIGDHTAWSMFTDAHRVLRPGGALVVVGNRHLGYHAKLGKIFGAVETIGSSTKFVVLHARR